MRPSVVVRTITLRNCATFSKRPCVLTVSWKALSEGVGSLPSAPLDTCTFCAWIADTTSLEVSPNVVSLSGSSQTRSE